MQLLLSQTDALETLGGMSRVWLHSRRKQHALYEPSVLTCGGGRGGRCLYDVRHLEVIRDVMLGVLTPDEGLERWNAIKNASAPIRPRTRRTA